MKKYIGGIILIFSIIISMILITYENQVPEKENQAIVPFVKTAKLESQNITANIKSQGFITPSLEINILAEVNAQVKWISNSMYTGASFSKGDTLIKLDSRDYELALISAESNVNNAEVNLKREIAESDLANKEWSRIGSGEGSDLTLRKPQLAQAESILAAAKAQFEQAKRNLERTVIIAPFNGRVLQNNTNIWSNVFAGNVLGIIYETNNYQVRLPITDQDIPFTGLRFNGNMISPINQLDVILKIEIGDSTNLLNAKVIRTEAKTDLKTQMRILVVRLNINKKDYSSYLTIGQFVEATIMGVNKENIIVVSRSLIKNNEAWVVDTNSILRKRIVKVWRYENEKAYIKDGFQIGDRLITSRLSNFIDGIKVKF